MPLRPKSASLGLALALSTTGFVAAPGLLAPAYAAPSTSPYVSELHYDNDGADAAEFVEVHLPAGTSSAGLSVVLYNGGSNAPYATIPLPAVTAPADAPTVVDVSAVGLQNGAPDGLALVRGSEVLEFLSYEGRITAAVGPAAGTTSTDIEVVEDGGDPAGESLSRRYDAATEALAWFGSDTATRGTVNPNFTPEPPPQICHLEPTHEIGDVQGEGASTPLAGSQVTVRGTVVGDLPSYNGFYLQDLDGDGAAATSDGIFVFSEAEVDLGDSVAVRGGAGEYFGQTQISSESDVQVCAEGSSADLPVAVPLDLPATDAEREPYEGMVVAPADTLTVSEVFALTRFGELMLSEGGVLVQPTELARPGTAEARQVADDNVLRRILLDDGLDSGTSATSRPYLSPMTPVRVGDQLTFISPVVLGYGFGNWRLQPADGSAEGTFASQNTRPAAPDVVGGDIQVGAFNVLNYFLTWTGPDARGARSSAQFEKQADKIVPAIEALDAEIVTLMEIEDTDSTGYRPGDADQALADLVSRLNEAAGDADRWTYVPLPDELYAVDRDVIRNGIIYQPDHVEPVGPPVGDVDETVWFNAREPIAQTFTAEGDVFTVVANHFKSKSPGEDPPTEGDNADSGDGQGTWNGDRVRQAEALAELAEELRSKTGDEDVLLMGDFNAYTQEDPIEVLRDAGFVDLGELLDPGRYSYVFDEMSGSLDHALASLSMVEKVTDLTHWNINAVESFAYQYTGDPALYAPNAYRSSDHDPLVLGIDLAYRCNGLVPTIVGSHGDDVLRGTNGADVIMGLGGDDVITGGNGEDVVCAGAGNDEVHGGNGDDVLYGGSGDDALHGGNGSDRLTGGRGDDALDQGKGKGPVVQDGPAT